MRAIICKDATYQECVDVAKSFDYVVINFLTEPDAKNFLIPNYFSFNIAHVPKALRMDFIESAVHTIAKGCYLRYTWDTTSYKEENLKSV